MLHNSEQPEIGFAAIVYWDFVDEAEEDELVATLENLYGGGPEQFGGMTFGGGSWQRQVFGNDANEIEQEEGFASVRTIVESETRGVLDVTTIAVLSKEQIETVIERDDRSGLQELRSTISEDLKRLPSFVDHESSNHCGIYYAEWNNGDLLSELDDATGEDVVEYLRNKHQPLFSFGFQVGGNLSLFRGKFLVAPNATMAPFEGLTVIRRNRHPNSDPLEKLILDPVWYIDVSGLKSYYRLNQWADSRWNQLHQFDSEADGARDLLQSHSSSQLDIDQVLPVSEEIQDLQINFTQFQTRYDAEYQSFRGDFKNRLDEIEDRFGNPIDIPLPGPSESEIEESPEGRTNSVIEYFEDASNDTLEKMNDRYVQVTEKIESLVSAIQARTRLAATDENLNLQNRVRKLTASLIFLTIILVALTLALVLVEVL